LWSRFSREKRGARERKSRASVARSRDQLAGDEAAREHAVGGDPDVELSARREDLLLDPARDQRVLDLQVDDRVDGVRAADGRGADLGEPDVADVAGIDELRDRAHGLLDRHVGVQARRAVDVDVVRAEPGERVGEEGLHGRRARVVAEPGTGGVALAAELDAEPDVVAAAAHERVADQQPLWPIP
jgi:hypothetical protein